ncbi:ScaI family restriction endonuclease [Hymenobacter gummosus]|uniref:ScaI family restriction endonuclease n=1 Tax=Hymenobacter gummosus TaxID=1776032 RepID=A0A431U8S3_9BACT|nr:ScaI family restriction endonuclease [Hymenobacter gummosus]RTQ53457.1 ScaI family restriction endonuclease [Hymenobacter gummosus]
MPAFPYHGTGVAEWSGITDSLIKNHPLSADEIRDVVLKSWDDIFESSIGSFYIGKDIFPAPQIMSFFLHELVAHYLSLRHPGVYKVGTDKADKDIQHVSDAQYSIEIKASSHKSQIFANRSYAQPQSSAGKKGKSGYYITINFENFKTAKGRPKILLIRFGYLDHTDWIAQKSETGQQARLGPDVYAHKLRQIYKAP